MFCKFASLFSRKYLSKSYFFTVLSFCLIFTPIISEASSVFHLETSFHYPIKLLTNMVTYHPIVIHVSNKNKVVMKNISFDVLPGSGFVTPSFINGDTTCSPGQNLDPGKSCNLFLSLKSGNVASTIKLNVRVCGFRGYLCTRLVLPIQIGRGFPVKVSGRVLRGLPKYVLKNTDYPVTFSYLNEDETLPATGIAIDKYIPKQFSNYTEYGYCDGVIPSGERCVISGIVNTSHTPLEARVQLHYIEGYAPELRTQTSNISSGSLATLINWYGGASFATASPEPNGDLPFKTIKNPDNVAYNPYPKYSAGNEIVNDNGKGYEFFANPRLYSCFIDKEKGIHSCTSQIIPMPGDIFRILRYGGGHLALVVANDKIYKCQLNSSGLVNFDSCKYTGKNNVKNNIFMSRTTGMILLQEGQDIKECRLDNRSGMFTSCHVLKKSDGSRFLSFDAGRKLIIFSVNHKYSICDISVDKIGRCVPGVFDKDVVIQNPINTVVSPDNYIYFTQPLNNARYGSIGFCNINLNSNTLENCKLKGAYRPSSLAFIN